MLSLLPSILIIIAALVGIGVSLYIEQKKRRHQLLVCPIGYNCNAVVASEYSRFFGIPLERLGLLYYAVIVLGYSFSLVRPSLPLNSLLFPVTLGALLFSMYLTFIQAFTLKDWCSWCLTSAIMSTLIFLSSTFVADFNYLITIFQAYQPIFIILHLFGLALGLGGATMADIFFFKFLADLKISEHERDTIRTISQVIWFGLGLLIVSGVSIVLTDPLFYLTSAKFLAKMFVVTVILINGAFLNLYITPRLIKISFGADHSHKAGELHHERGLAYASGAISVTSWYTAFILGFLDQSPLSLWPMLVLYFLVLGIGVAVSQIVERRIARRPSKLVISEKEAAEPDEII